ncbi:MAG TPA: ABC transporter transmembrane domain-containing protein, partial [Myxococcota bacterium]|nr:ABC transporter transmembrane domain-containing protein [Myxococcota bacterium]
MTRPPGVEEEVLQKGCDGALMRRLLAYVRPYKWQVALAVLLLVVASGLAAVGPWLTQRAIDDAIPNGDRDLLGLLTLAYLGAAAGAFVFQYAQGLLTTWLGQSVMYDLRREIFAKLQKLDLKFYDRTPVGRLMTRITSDVETLNELLSSGLVTVFGDVFTLFFIFGFMITMDWQLSLV